MDDETHNVCNTRLKKEGGKAKCCDCHPHAGCDFEKEKIKNFRHRMIGGKKIKTK